MKWIVWISLGGWAAACSTAPTVQTAGDPVVRKLDNYTIEVDQKGLVWVEVANAACAGNPVRLKLKGEGATQEAQARCRFSGPGGSPTGVPVAQFAASVWPGKLRVEVADAGAAKGEPRGHVFFVPQEPESHSGPDQTYLGASPLQDGPNAGSLHPSQGDRTDWWSVTVAQPGRGAIFLQCPTSVRGLQANWYRFSDGSLTLKQRLSWNRVSELQMEGTYYLKISGDALTPQVAYSVAFKGPAAAAGGAAGGVSGGEAPAGGKVQRIHAVLETWPLDAGKTAVLVGGGSDHDVKLGEMMKVFRAGQFVDACKVVGVGPSESECHVERANLNRVGLSVKRGGS